jgi:hypothetical protein
VRKEDLPRRPTHSGDVTISVTVEYYDSVGKKQEKIIKAEISAVPSDGENDKKTKVQDKLDEELAKQQNQVGGHSLASTSGGGDVMTATPAADPGDGSFTGAKIKKISLVAPAATPA